MNNVCGCDVPLRLESQSDEGALETDSTSDGEAEEVFPNLLHGGEELDGVSQEQS